MDIGNKTTHIILDENIIVNDIAQYFSSLNSKDWNTFTYRQDSFIVHKNTKTIGAIWSDMNGSEIEYLEQYKIYKEQFDILIDLVLKSSEKYYNIKFKPIKAMIALLPPKSNIPEHTDSAYIFGVARRIHIPLVNNTNVNFYIEGKVIPMDIGTIVEINNRKLHKVINDSNESRLQFICDIVEDNGE